MSRWLDPTLLPPDATAVVNRAAAHLALFTGQAPKLGAAEVRVYPHEEGDNERPLVVVREPVEASRPGVSERAARIEVLVEVDKRSNVAAYDPRLYVTALHRWALRHLVGFDPEAVSPLPHATRILPLVLWLPPTPSAEDGERGTVYSIATLLATLSSRPDAS